jgi:hypothetical protein
MILWWGYDFAQNEPRILKRMKEKYKPVQQAYDEGNSAGWDEA